MRNKKDYKKVKNIKRNNMPKKAQSKLGRITMKLVNSVMKK